MSTRSERRVIAVGLAVTLLVTIAPGRVMAETPLRVLILTGEDSQNKLATTPVLRRILADTGRFDVRVCESPAGLTPRSLEGFDLLIDNGVIVGGETEKSIADFIESGRGLVVAHGALGIAAAPAFWPALADSRARPPVTFLDVTITRPEHPIVAGMNAKFRTADSSPRGVTVRGQAEVLATAKDAKGDGQAEPVLVVSRAGKGRVVLLALGHDPSALHEPQVIATIARASEWAASGKVTLPSEPGPSRPSRGAVRGLVITGGHDHETAFYSLFDGYNDLQWLPVDSSANAFKKDLRDKYEVLIMYDFSRDLDDAGKKNLREFVESGKGVVVLHHALLNYQTWTWWSEDVVGGRYRLRPEGSSPSSSVKDNQEIYVTPTAAHPVLDGIAPFHITDEAYKNLFMAQRITPLLTTDNPTSDTNLAWIGPCQTSRVIAIQLGHGHSAFAHPSYRALVHNAILWAAGKTK
jgi:type 1 glutamine amidotransferase